MKRGILHSGLQMACVLLFACTLAVSTSLAKPNESAALRELDIQWAKAASAMDLDGTVSYYADDASLFAPNAPVATGKAAIRSGWAQLLVGFSGGWQPVKVEVSRSGDLGYITGTYDIKFTGPDGKPEADRGKYVEVWKKQPDGKWKCVADIYNSDLPLAGTAH
jgi:ketosteroid isomerase-like protein